MWRVLHFSYVLFFTLTALSQVNDATGFTIGSSMGTKLFTHHCTSKSAASFYMHTTYAVRFSTSVTSLYSWCGGFILTLIKRSFRFLGCQLAVIGGFGTTLFSFSEVCRVCRWLIRRIFPNHGSFGWQVTTSGIFSVFNHLFSYTVSYFLK